MAHLKGTKETCLIFIFDIKIQQKKMHDRKDRTVAFTL